MAYSSSFTGNPDMDLRILFSLPDRELRHLCSANKYLRALCSSPNVETYWQERYQQHFPNIPSMPGTWYEKYWHTAEQQQLSDQQLSRLLTSSEVQGPCLIPYLRQLARQLFHLLATTPPAVMQQKIDEDEGEFVDPLQEVLANHLSPPYTRAVKIMLHILLDEERDIATPWGLNHTIVQDNFFHWALPSVTGTLPITVNIHGQVGTHELTQMQFLGMLLYANYATQGGVAFYLGNCPMHYTPTDIRWILRGKLIETGQDGVIRMLNGDEFALPAIEEFMQGFITLARWLGQNYRCGYWYALAGSVPARTPNGNIYATIKR